MCKLTFMLSVTALLLLVGGALPAQAGLASNDHKHEKHTSKERLKDGVYTARDANHLENGQHNVEFDHEAIVGSVKEAEEFDTLPPLESKKRLGELLKLMDLNSDGYIDRHELGAWILRSFKKLAEEEATDRFDEIDQNEDKNITWKEYLQDAYGMEDENFKKEVIDFDSYDEEQKMIKDDKEMFNAADINKDGTLSLGEFVYFINPEEHEIMLPVVVEHTMRDKDKNHDGVIDFTEYIDGRSDSKEFLLAEKEQFEGVFDLNKNGVLDGNEVIAWVVPSHEQVAKDEVDHLFAATDEDHDDRLSYIEVLNNYDTFVGSEATDYGDHLRNIHRLADEL